jgi:hypothetical protein
LYKSTQPTSEWHPVFDKPHTEDETAGEQNINEPDNGLVVNFPSKVELKIDFTVNNKEASHINLGYSNDSSQDTKL